MAKLIALSGLPGVGKTTVARDLARQIKAAHLRVDSVEAAMKNSVLKIHPAEDAGYLVLASLAKDNLRLGMDVIVDTVNPLKITRKLWTSVANEARAELINVEIVCEDKSVHRQRVEARSSDIKGLIVPTWDNVMARKYDLWTEERIVVDTSKQTLSECAAMIVNALRSQDYAYR